MNNNYQTMYKDCTEYHFNNADMMEAFLDKTDNESEWIRIPTDRLNVTALDDENDFDLDADIDNIEDARARSATGLVIELDGRKLICGATIVPTMHMRACLSGSALKKMNSAEHAQVMNIALGRAEGKSLVRVCGGRATALHGGDDKDYSIIPESGQFRLLRSQIETYDSSKFLSGYWSHSFMTATWDIKDEDIAKAYCDIFEQAYIPLMPEDVKTLVTLKTSDTASSSATIWYTIEAEGTTCVIGSNLKLRHSGGAKTNLDSFRKLLVDLFAGYTAAFESLEKLNDITINNPYECIMALTKKADLPDKYCKKAAQRFIDELGEDPVSAMLLYCYGINGMLDFAKEAGETMNNIMMYQEKIARTLKMKFKDFDHKKN